MTFNFRKGEQAEYGKQIIASLSKKLTQADGKGFRCRQLHYCLRIAETFPDEKILHTLCSQLSWSHLRLLIIIDDPIKRNFYIEIAQLENWSVRLPSRTYKVDVVRAYCHLKKTGENHTTFSSVTTTGRFHPIWPFVPLICNIRVADYLTALPKQAVLEAKLYQSIENARKRLLVDDE